ncbi:MAG: MqnA/MqnD/SBP family protein [Helicobacter sp.]|nr:MqnA/MqnD/SBP family protein [Helicobacter sp.]
MRSPLAHKSHLQIAHSPDADDIFMYYALYFGWVGDDFKLTNKALDIEALNKAALQLRYEASAISFALYPKICNDYALLRTAHSFGNGYGPKLIKKRGKKLKRNCKVALSGENTTNAMIFKLFYKDARIYYMNFLDIEGAVLRGEVDAGILIHESILHFSSDLEVEAEIWDIWRDLAGDLPLPLGGMAILRSIPLLRALRLEEELKRAITVAWSAPKIFSEMLFERNLIRVNESELKTYLGLYADKSSIWLNPLQKSGINKLFELGFDGGFYTSKLDCEDYFIPSDYASLRYS